MAAPIGGGTPRTLASGLDAPDAIAVDATNVYVATNGSSEKARTDGTILRVPTAGGTVTVLATGRKGPGALAIDSM